MTTVKIHHAKTHLSRLIEQACEGEEIIIARDDQPLVRLQPLQGKKGGRKPGCLKGTLTVGPEFFEPLPEDELKHWE
ncbi:MAG TPA: type II toxin-antitoxin system Phd/YefM family antitoxin [Methylomirabilota bacterium]|nr:type II toxin-antitoxin system Phd/YefM family antitoxin [Methylomirabilota bacterium]